MCRRLILMDFERRGRSSKSIKVHSNFFLPTFNNPESMNRLTSFGRHAGEIGAYIYRLIDPRSGHTFYVGKGRGDRAFTHSKNQLKELDASQDDKDNEDYFTDKNKRIAEIIADRLEVLYVIHRHSIETVAKNSMGL